MTTNKDFKDFFDSLKNNNVEEGVGTTALKLLGPAAMAYQGYQAYQRYKKGDYPGAALSAAGAIPGPVGWAAVGADYARGEKDDQPETPKEPETTKSAETSSDIVPRKVKATIEKESGGKMKSFKQFTKNK